MTAPRPTPADRRSGIGWDSHRLVEGRPFILGGVQIDSPVGLHGHSDADVLAHAITDALLGAAGLGDIGDHFPDTDAAYAGADSIKLLEDVLGKVRALGWEVENVDTTVVAERPKLGPKKRAIAERLAEVLGLHPSAVGVKASTGEGLGFVGRGEGVAALAVAQLRGSAGSTSR
ncbi:MAG: 2-C-methyl-D-erythritol 2,4-cyclodiphosphate synthase [Solirubrobacteraceae bacterium]|nr:2-C-methyl-D-erythritol 2,4-cyclodiphosphate synthase [Solirubrobacteraceae bacterium]